MHKSRLSLALLGCLTSVLFLGCKTSDSVVAATGTTIGVDLSQNPQTQFYEAKLGYNRGELAFVPTNRKNQDGTSTGNGAKDSADVLMELKYGQIFSISDGGIYQRLAVGPTAVGQPGAAFMFARDESGNLEPETAAQVSAAVSEAKPFSTGASFLAASAIITALQEMSAESQEARSILKELDTISVPRTNSHPLYFWRLPMELSFRKVGERTYGQNFDGYKAYRSELRHSVEGLRGALEGVQTNAPIKLITSSPSGAVTNPITSDDVFTLQMHLQDQKSRLDAVQQRFATNRAVSEALKFFNQSMNPK